jgi:hypothetical protein
MDSDTILCADNVIQVCQLALVERFEAVFGETPIIAAVRMLPQGIAALLVAMVIPYVVSKPPR